MLRKIEDLSIEELRDLVVNLIESGAIVQNMHPADFASAFHSIDWPEKSLKRQFYDILDEYLIELGYHPNGWREIFATEKFKEVERRCKKVPHFDKEEYRDWVASLSWLYR